MTSTSSEAVVVRGDLGHAAAPSVGHPDLRAGTWTRLGASTVLGDSATEATLGALADRARAAGTAQGYAAGWSEGRRRAQEEADRAAEEHAAAAARARTEMLGTQQSLVDALTAAVERCDADLASRQAELADAAVSLGLRIAEAVLQREVATMVDPGAEALRRALAEVPPTVTATVRMHPADLAALDHSVLAGRPVTVVADAGVPTAGAVLETEVTTVDATIESALARVREVLAR